MQNHPSNGGGTIHEPDRLDSATVRAALLGREFEIIAKLLPDGTRRGKEWHSLAPGRNDRHLGSFSVAIEGERAGQWYDFANGEGGDLFDLVRLVYGIDFPGALQYLARECGIDVPDPHLKIPRPDTGKVTEWKRRVAAGRSRERGCSVEQLAVVKKLSVQFLHELGLRNIPARDATSNNPARVSIAVIPYHDREGNETAHRLRTDIIAKWGSCWKRDDKPTLYGLNRLTGNESRILLVEGESDCWCLWNAGIVAIGIPGASMWRNEWPDLIPPKAAIFAVQEPDAAGSALIAKLRASPIAARLRVVKLSEKDPADLWVKNPNVEQFRDAMEQAMIEDGVDPDSPIAVAPNPVTERLLAQRLAQCDLNTKLRWIIAGPEAGLRAWDGKRWAATTAPVPRPLAAAVHKEIGSLIAEGLLDIKLARFFESTSAMRAILAQLQDYDSMKMDVGSIDPPGLLATPQGVLDLFTGDLLPHDPERPITRLAGVAHDAQVQSPYWDMVVQHLDALKSGDHGILRRYIGAAAVGRAPDRKLLWLYGNGGDGKSTLMRILRGALGEYSTSIPAEALAVDGARGAHGHELLAPLFGSRLAAAMEVPANVNWPLLKSLSGGDQRTTKRSHGRFYSFEPRCHLIIASNEEPRVLHGDQAARDRLVVIRWHRPSEPDPELSAVLSVDCPERDALYRAALGWIVTGAAEYIREGYGIVDTPIIGYQAPVGLAAWWLDRVDSGAFRIGDGWTPAASLMEDARQWCSKHSMESPSDTAVGTFVRTMVARDRRGEKRTTRYAVGVQDDKV